MRSICDEMSDEKARFRQASHPQKSMPPLNSAPWKEGNSRIEKRKTPETVGLTVIRK